MHHNQNGIQEVTQYVGEYTRHAHFTYAWFCLTTLQGDSGILSARIINNIHHSELRYSTKFSKSLPLFQSPKLSTWYYQLTPVYNTPFKYEHITYWKVSKEEVNLNIHTKLVSNCWNWRWIVEACIKFITNLST